jgi:hypothetical protein
VTRCLAPLLIIAALAGCGGGEGRAGPAEGPDPDAFMARADSTCDRVQRAARDGPRFPFRDFDPSNPDGRLRAVGRFYRRLDSEGTVRALAAELGRLRPPASLDAVYGRTLADLKALVTAMRAQTRAALRGDRAQMIEATAAVDAAFETQHESASDLGAFLCALSLERNPKTLR